MNHNPSKCPPVEPQTNWFSSAYAAQLLDVESPLLKRALKQITGPRVLQIGTAINSELLQAVDFPQLLVCSRQPQLHSDATFGADPAFLPVQSDSISSVVLPHVLEGHPLPHQVLREAHRVLMPDGYLLLTGMNPYSIPGLQRWLWRRAVFRGTFYSVARTIDWLQLLGFEVVGSAMFQYAPLSKSERLRNAMQFLNAIGDRWLPMTGGGFMITARKREQGTTLVGKIRFSRPKPKMAAASPAKISNNQFSNL